MQLGILPLAVVVEIVAADRLGVLALSSEPPAVMKAARSSPKKCRPLERNSAWRIERASIGRGRMGHLGRRPSFYLCNQAPKPFAWTKGG